MWCSWTWTAWAALRRPLGGGTTTGTCCCTACAAAIWGATAGGIGTDGIDRVRRCGAPGGAPGGMVRGRAVSWAGCTLSGGVMCRNDSSLADSSSISAAKVFFIQPARSLRE